MRQQYGQSTTGAALYNELGIAFATGNTTGYRTVVHVRWGWIVYPVILVGLTTLFTIATITSTAKRDIPAWKSSTLALMLRGPFSRTISSSEADLEKRAGNTKTYLKKTDRGWRMVKDVDGTRWLIQLRGKLLFTPRNPYELWQITCTTISDQQENDSFHNTASAGANCLRHSESLKPSYSFKKLLSTRIVRASTTQAE